METVCYKKLANDISVSFDVHFPAIDRTPVGLAEPSSTPTVIYFHGGGLTVGNRQSWFPTWLQRRVLSLGFLFISSDYQLMPPATGHDVVQDIQDLFAFLVKARLGSHRDGKSFRVNPEAIAVSGSSAGALCAYLAVMHSISPKPKAMVTIYGMGGNCFTSHYLQPKSQVFFRGREMLNPSDFDQYLYPFKEVLEPTSDSPLLYHPQTFHIPGYPANPRMLLARLYLQLGEFLDYYTGQHNPSLSAMLRELLDETGPTNLASFNNLIPESHRRLFPQLADQTSWPPTLLLHGTADSAVPIEESRNLRALLESARVSVDLIEFKGKEHSFDYEQDAELTWAGQFDAVKVFLRKELAP